MGLEAAAGAGMFRLSAIGRSGAARISGERSAGAHDGGADVGAGRSAGDIGGAGSAAGSLMRLVRHSMSPAAAPA